MKNYTFLVVGTKGGAGKSTVASQMLPLLFIDKKIKINIFELDNNNKTKVSSSLMNIKSFKTESEDIVDLLDDTSFSLDMDENIVNIIDVGGGSDTVQILKYLKRTKVAGCKYIIPANSDTDQYKNVVDTMAMIENIEENPEICICLNRCKSLNSADIKKEFSFAFNEEGNSTFKNADIWCVSDSPVYQVLKQKYEIALIDMCKAGMAISDDIKEKKMEWVKKGKDFYLKQLKKFRFFQDCLEIKKEVEPLRNFVFKGAEKG